MRAIVLASIVFLFIPSIAVLISEATLISFVLSGLLIIISLKIGTFGSWNINIWDNFYISGSIEMLFLLLVLIITASKYYSFFRNFLANRGLIYSQIIEITKFNNDSFFFFNVLLAKRYKAHVKEEKLEKLMEHYILVTENRHLFLKEKNKLKPNERELLGVVFAEEQIEALVEEKHFKEATEIVNTKLKVAVKYIENGFILTRMSIFKIWIMILQNDYELAKAAVIFLKQSLSMNEYIKVWIEILEYMYLGRLEKAILFAARHSLTNCMQMIVKQKVSKKDREFIVYTAITKGSYSLLITCLEFCTTSFILDVLNKIKNKTPIQRLMLVRVLHATRDLTREVIDREELWTEIPKVIKHPAQLLSALDFLVEMNSEEDRERFTQLFDEIVFTGTTRWRCKRCSVMSSEIPQIFCLNCKAFNYDFVQGFHYRKEESTFDAMSNLFSII